MNISLSFSASSHKLILKIVQKKRNNITVISSANIKSHSIVITSGLSYLRVFVIVNQ